MGKEMTGTIIEKSFRPPPGAPEKYWCYLMIDTEHGGRITIRIRKKYVDRVTIGDRIRFIKHWRKNKPSKVIEIVNKARL